VSSTDFHTTNLVDVNWTVTVFIEHRLPVYHQSHWWHRLFLNQQTVLDMDQDHVADVHKFSAVWCLSWRLLDRSKNAIFNYPTFIWIPIAGDLIWIL